MTKFLTFLIAFVFAVNADAQSAKKTTKVKAAKPAVQEPAVAASSTPALTKKEPRFAGFTGSFIKFGKVAGGSRTFSMSVEFKPWFFKVSGSANADHNTADLDLLLDGIVGVLAYYDAPGKAQDGTIYQAGLFDFMIYLDDEPIKISNLNFELLSKATAGATILEQAKTWNFPVGSVFKNKKYNDQIFEAQADPLDKANLAKIEAAEKKRVADSIAAEKKRVADSIAKVEKRKKDSIAAERRRVEDSIAEFEALKEQAKRKAAAAKKKKRVVEEYEDEEDEDYEPPVKKKKPAVVKKKKKPVVEEYEDEEDEEYEPPVKKKKVVKKKKKKAVDEDEE